MNVKEVSKLTNLSPGTIYNYVSAKKIPFKRISEKRVIFDREEIEKWMAKRSYIEVKERSDGEKNLDFDKKELSTALSERLGRRKAAIFLFSIRYPFIVLTMFIVFIAFGWIGGLYFSKNRLEVDDFFLKTFFGSNENFSETIMQNANQKKDSIDKKINRIGFKYDSNSDVIIENKPSSKQIRYDAVSELKSKSSIYSEKSIAINNISLHLDNPVYFEALVYSLHNEEDPVLRLKAISVLEKIIDQKKVQTILIERLLLDENDGIRLKALDVVKDHLNRENLEILIQLLEKEKNPLLRAKLKAVVKKLSMKNKKESRTK
jgi:excisionase family DNA binding protein